MVIKNTAILIREISKHTMELCQLILNAGGVAALIGSARRELGREFGDTIPIIGFPRWDEIKDNELLVKDGPSQVNFSSKSGVQYYTKDLGWF